MPEHSPRKLNFFEIASSLNQLFHLVTVGDAGDVLLDNWPGIELFCNVVACGSD